ncbi:MAG: DUF1573 domain-containing protein [Prosthecobacter sp.]
MKVFTLLLFFIQTTFAGGLRWESTTQHFEAHPGQREIRTEFPHRNTGKAPVRFESVCGACICCTSASATKKLLEPGESGVIVVKVDLERKRFPLVKPVTVKTDDGQTTVLILEIVSAER